MRESINRPRIQAILERVIEKERRQLKNSRVVEPLQTEALHRPQIICEAGLVAQLLKNCPESIASHLAVTAFQMLADVSFNAIVIEQRVVYIEEKDPRASTTHGRLIPAGRDAATGC